MACYMYTLTKLAPPLQHKCFYVLYCTVTATHHAAYHNYRHENSGVKTVFFLWLSLLHFLFDIKSGCPASILATFHFAHLFASIFSVKLAMCWKSIWALYHTWRRKQVKASVKIAFWRHAERNQCVGKYFNPLPYSVCTVMASCKR